MRKFLLSILFVLFASTANATVYTAVAAGGNWSTNATWGGAGHPIAGDTANIDGTMTGTVTVDAASACAVLNMTGNGGTLALGNNTLTVTGGVTLGGTITAGTGTLILTGAQTLTSNGITWPGKLQFNFAGTFTLVGNWVNTGLVTVSLAATINKTTAETITMNGGLTCATTIAGTTTVVLGGGTWLWNGGTMTTNLTFAGNVSIQGGGSSTNYNTGTITYTSGTITFGSDPGNSSQMIINGNATINTNGMTWDRLAIGSNSATMTLTSNLQCNVFYVNRNQTYTVTGGDITAGTFYSEGGPFSQILILQAGRTINVTSALDLTYGRYSTTVNSSTTTIKSGTASSAIFLNYTGTTAKGVVTGITFTDVTASGNKIYNYDGGTLTRTSGIVNVTPANIGGFNMID